VARRTGSGRIRCGSTPRGHPCAKGYEWTGRMGSGGIRCGLHDMWTGV
jgi:hypothetical protein